MVAFSLNLSCGLAFGSQFSCCLFFFSPTVLSLFNVVAFIFLAVALEFIIDILSSHYQTLITCYFYTIKLQNNQSFLISSGLTFVLYILLLHGKLFFQIVDISFLYLSSLHFYYDFPCLENNEHIVLEFCWILLTFACLKIFIVFLFWKYSFAIMDPRLWHYQQEVHLFLCFGGLHPRILRGYFPALCLGDGSGCAGGLCGVRDGAWTSCMQSKCWVHWAHFPGLYYYCL